jgi:thiol-disulfide isomerase/thioredoxin
LHDAGISPGNISTKSTLLYSQFAGRSITCAGFTGEDRRTEPHKYVIMADSARSGENPGGVKKKKRSWKREITEWVIFLGIIGVLYATGLHTPVLGFFQSIILKTGIFQPKIIEHDARAGAYNFTMLDADNKTVQFSAFEGEVVFINLWATWCPPCIAEMPDINRLYQHVGDEVQFVMISLDDDFDKARKFVSKKGFDFPIYRLASPLPPAYDSNAIPTTFVLDREGIIVARRSGMAKYNTEKFRTFLLNLL